jgi:hypothetical protein
VRHADVVVIGAGIVGLATALRLLEQRPDLRIVILEKEATIVFDSKDGTDSLREVLGEYMPLSLSRALERREQALDPGKRRKQVLRNLLPAEIPKHSPQFIVFVETDPVIDGIQFMRAALKEDMTAFSVGVITKQVEEHNRFEELFVFLAEAEVVIFGIVFDELLERTFSIRTIVAERGKRDDVKAKRLADAIRGDLAPCQRVLGEIPERLFAARRLINSRILPAFMINGDKERVIRAKGELAFEFIITMLEGKMNFLLIVLYHQGMILLQEHKLRIYFLSAHFRPA